MNRLHVRYEQPSEHFKDVLHVGYDFSQDRIHKKQRYEKQGLSRMRSRKMETGTRSTTNSTDSASNKQFTYVPPQYNQLTKESFPSLPQKIACSLDPIPSRTSIPLALSYTFSDPISSNSESDNESEDLMAQLSDYESKLDTLNVPVQKTSHCTVSRQAIAFYTDYGVIFSFFPLSVHNEQRQVSWDPVHQLQITVDNEFAYESEQECDELSEPLLSYNRQISIINNGVTGTPATETQNSYWQRWFGNVWNEPVEESTQTFTFKAGVIPDDHPYCWKKLMENPKEDKGTCIPELSWRQRLDHSLFGQKELLWRTQHTGGFLRLFTMDGYLYWTLQNMAGHLTPDWKIHFSVTHADIERAWNIIAGLFMEYQSLSLVGMKATYSDPAQWGAQRGREITVYAFQFDQEYAEMKLDKGLERYGPKDTFWRDFILEAERRLSAANIEPHYDSNNRAVADGDLELPGCRYASLRNEAFVEVPSNPDSLIYPPNDTGFNAIGQPNPFDNVIEQLRDEVEKRYAEEFDYLFYFLL